MIIAGVDFSGAKKQVGKTCVAYGSLLENGGLWLEGVQPTTREGLHQWIEQLPPPAVVAMDFPFGVPSVFATWLCGGSKPVAMPDVWQAIANMPQEHFIAAGKQFVGYYRESLHPGVSPLPAGTVYCCNGEPHRAGDAKYLSGPFSPLHSTNPTMPQMTYHGIRLLERLHRENPAARWRVPPMKSDAPDRETITLLETMPGAFLQVCGLPARGYKTGGKVPAMRGNILDGLPARSGWPDLDLSGIRDNCLRNDDCLDAVVAFVCAASWARCQAHFHHPTDGELAAARLEGWIYIPKSILCESSSSLTAAGNAEPGRDATPAESV